MKGLCLSVFLGFFLLQGAVLAATGSDGNTGSSALAEQLGRKDAASDDFSQLNSVMEEAGFTGDEIVRVRAGLNEAVSHGVPSGPLLGKINEGLVKGASAEQIIRAMTMVGERYTRAGQYMQELGMTKTNGAVVLPLLVNVQTAGMAADELNKVIFRLREATGRSNDHADENRLIRETLIFTQELRRLGVQSELVADLVSSLLAKGADSADFSNMTANFRRMSDRRIIGEQARRWLDTIETGANIAEVRKSMQTRFNGWAEKTTKSQQKNGEEQGKQQGQGNGSGQQNGGGNSGSGGASGNGAGNGAHSGGGAGHGDPGQQGQ